MGQTIEGGCETCTYVGEKTNLWSKVGAKDESLENLGGGEIANDRR